MIKNNLPKNIAVFPLSNAVFFPRTILPLNIFEDRYIQLVSDCMKKDRMFGMVQPKTGRDEPPEVYKVGCLGKIISFNETTVKRFIICRSGIFRFRILKEIKMDKLYRNFDVSYSEFLGDLEEDKSKIKNNELNDLLNKIKIFFGKINYPIDFDKLNKLSLDQIVSTVSMISPFSIEEKQKLIETITIQHKAKILDEIINFKLFEMQENKTVQ